MPHGHEMLVAQTVSECLKRSALDQTRKSQFGFVIDTTLAGLAALAGHRELLRAAMPN